MLYKYSNNKLTPFKAVCSDCKEWLIENECRPLYDSEDVICDKCYGELKAKQLDKPEG